MVKSAGARTERPEEDFSRKDSVHHVIGEDGELQFDKEVDFHH